MSKFELATKNREEATEGGWREKVREIENRGREGSEGVSEPLRLELRGISKTFGGERALIGVNLRIGAGEVHGLLGANGSGKSTLVKILAGFHAPDPGGTMYVDGTRATFPLRPGEARRLGMEFVHQDLGLIPSLSVVENLRIEALAGDRRVFINWRKERERAERLFDTFEVNLRADRLVRDLSPIEEAELAIVRAASGLMDAGADGRPGRLLVLDEPTVFLPKKDVDSLFHLVRRLVAEGRSVMLISHALDEVLAVTDRVTVLRDGRVHATVLTRACDDSALVEMIVGQVVERYRTGTVDRSDRAPEGGAHISVKELCGGIVRDATLTMDRGEIVGVTGLVGSGFEQIPYLLYGAMSSSGGTLTLGNEEHYLPSMTPRRALAAGLVLIPGDRQKDGAVGTLSLEDNIMLPVFSRHRLGLVLRRRKMVREAAELLRRFGVRPDDPRALYAQLSGGNQQRVVLAKWLGMSPRLLLLHEPTQGIDIGARWEILKILRQVADQGVSLLVASADYEQLSLECDRVIIFQEGTVRIELSGKDITEETIAGECYGGGMTKVERPR